MLWLVILRNLRLSPVLHGRVFYAAQTMGAGQMSRAVATRREKVFRLQNSRMARKRRRSQFSEARRSPLLGRMRPSRISSRWLRSSQSQATRRPSARGARQPTAEEECDQLHATPKNQDKAGCLHATVANSCEPSQEPSCATVAGTVQPSQPSRKLSQTVASK